MRRQIEQWTQELNVEQRMQKLKVKKEGAVVSSALKPEETQNMDWTSLVDTATKVDKD